MSFLKTLGLGAYYRVRRMKKALKNWRKFGVIIFGGLVLAASTGVMTPLNIADASGLEYLYVNPAAISVETTKTYQFEYRAYDANWQEMTVSPTWSIINSQAGTIDSSGLFTAGNTKGTYAGAVKLSVGALSTYARVVVVEGNNPDPDPDPDPSQLTYLYVDPAAISVGVGQSYDFNYTAYDQDWQSMTIPVTWSVSNPTMGTIDQNGNITAGQTKGTYNNAVKVSSGALSAYARVVVVGTTPPPPVNQPPVAHIVANPNSGYSPMITTLNAEGSYDVDGTIVSYEWDRDGNGTYDIVTGTVTTQYTYPTNGTFYPSVRVTDDDGATDIASTTVVVNQAPEPTVCSYINISTLNPNLYVGDTANVDLEARDNQGGYLDYNDLQWNWNLGWFDVYGNNLYHATQVGTATLTARCPGNPFVSDSIVFNVQDIYIQQEYLIGVDGWASDNSLYNYESTNLSAYSWTNLHNPRSGASYRWEKLSGVGYLSGDLYSSHGARFNANNIVGSATLRVTASWGGASVTDTVIVYVNSHIIPPPPPPPVPEHPIYTSFVGIVEGGGTACDNDVIQYTIKLGNFNQNLISGVRLKMDIPRYTSFLSASSATDHPRLEDGVIVWDAGTIYTNEIETLIVRVMLDDNFPATYIQGNAYVDYDQLNGNFNIKSNKIYTCGTTEPVEPLTPTGVDWQIMALLAMISLGLTTLTYGFMKRKESQMVSF